MATIRVNALSVRAFLALGFAYRPVNRGGRFSLKAFTPSA